MCIQEKCVHKSTERYMEECSEWYCSDDSQLETGKSLPTIEKMITLVAIWKMGSKR